MSPCSIRPARAEDLQAIVVLGSELWPDHASTELREHFGAILTGTPQSTLPLVLFVAEAPQGLVGFIEIGLRSHAQGCDGRHAVGFIEGWYVRPEHRRSGIGRALVARAEAWSSDQGALEIASDTWIDHQLSIDAHLALGYEIAERTINFRKRLA